MNLIDLFAGIGGFSLAAHWMGWNTVAFCEQSEFCKKVLRKNFNSDIPIYDDIRTFPSESYSGRCDIITGGFPCQPYSTAGRRLGTTDERHLWPAMFKVIVGAEPDYVVGENVHGLLNWSGGLVFEQVQADLESAGYDVWAGVLPACGVNAPHRRNRVWFVANAKHTGDMRRSRTNEGQGKEERVQKRNYIEWPPKSTGLRPLTEDGNSCQWQRFPTQPPIRRRDDGLPDRVDRIKSLGNSIVPQVALQIFRAIEKVNGQR